MPWPWANARRKSWHDQNKLLKLEYLMQIAQKTTSSSKYHGDQYKKIFEKIVEKRLYKL